MLQKALKWGVTVLLNLIPYSIRLQCVPKSAKAGLKLFFISIEFPGGFAIRRFGI